MYTDDDEWAAGAQTVVQTESGEMRTQAVLDRPLGANPLLTASIFCPEGLCSEALVDHNGKCVIMQLAKLLKTSVAQIEKEIGSERVPAEAIAKVAMARGMPLYILHNGRKIKEYKPQTNYKQGCLALTVESDHAYVYSSESTKRSISHMAVETNQSIGMTKPRLLREFESKRPPSK